MSSSQIIQTRASQTYEQVNVPFVNDFLQVARQGHSFQTREVLQRIVLAEQQRIKEEQMLWRIGGAVVGACLGLGDGFQLTDLFVGMACSTIAGTGHEVISHEDRQFLDRCQALWLVGRQSPLELMQRIGPARSRILLYDPSWQSPVVFNHHQGYRGEHLVPLGNAGNLAPGFADARSLEVLQLHFQAEDLEILRCQLYPHAQEAVPIKRLVPISKPQAITLDPHAPAFLASCQSVKIETDNGIIIGYQLPIPVHSDF